MAYAALGPFSTGDILTAADMTQARDNDEFLIDPPTCSVYNNAAVSTTTAVLTTMAANSENFDNDSMHSTVTNNSRITFTTAGRYLVMACVVWDANTTGERLVDFLVDGTTQYVGIAVSANTSGSQNTGLTASRMIVATAGQYVECRTRQRSGGNLNAQLYEFAAQFLTR